MARTSSSSSAPKGSKIPGKSVIERSPDHKQLEETRPESRSSNNSSVSSGVSSRSSTPSIIMIDSPRTESPEAQLQEKSENTPPPVHQEILIPPQGPLVARHSEELEARLASDNFVTKETFMHLQEQVNSMRRRFDDQLKDLSNFNGDLSDAHTILFDKNNVLQEQVNELQKKTDETNENVTEERRKRKARLADFEKRVVEQFDKRDHRCNLLEGEIGALKRRCDSLTPLRSTPSLTPAQSTVASDKSGHSIPCPLCLAGDHLLTNCTAYDTREIRLKEFKKRGLCRRCGKTECTLDTCKNPKVECKRCRTMGRTGDQNSFKHLQGICIFNPRRTSRQDQSSSRRGTALMLPQQHQQMQQQQQMAPQMQHQLVPQHHQLMPQQQQQQPMQMIVQNPGVTSPFLHNQPSYHAPAYPMHTQQLGQGFQGHNLSMPQLQAQGPGSAPQYVQYYPNQ